jgi:aminoglycoside phosphotransferase
VTNRLDPDGSGLLTSPQVADLLTAAVAHGGGTLVSWQLDHVDAIPRRSTTATYSATVDWPFGRRDEILGASARAGGPSAGDDQAVIFADGDRQVAVGLYPRDPELPGLLRAAFTEGVAALLNEHQVFGQPIRPSQVELEMIGYRPRRRAVLKASVTVGELADVFYLKVLRESSFAATVHRHQLLVGAGVPAPEVVVASSDALLVLRQLPGRNLSRAIFDPTAPCEAGQLIELLDAMPAEVARLERRSPWTDAVEQYADLVAATVPALGPRLQWLAAQIRSGLASVPAGLEATHGDFHEGQLLVSGGRISGVLDVETIGPGRRVDDLACLLAHLSTVQRMDPTQTARVQRLIADWLPVFDARVDPTELRLRAAAVTISLATGPYRSQEPSWERETVLMVDTAERWVRSIR